MSAYVDLVSRFTYRMLVTWADLDALGENDAALYDDGWVQSTATVWFQSAAPTGWTKLTSNNDKIMRVTSGAGGGTGGAQALSTPITLAHSAHTITSAPNHTHVMGDHQHLPNADNVNIISGSGNVMVGTGDQFIKQAPAAGAVGGMDEISGELDIVSGQVSGSAGSHDHGGNTTGSRLTDLAYAYIDVIVCTKDANAGTYTPAADIWSTGVDIIYQDLHNLGVNDKYNKDRLTPSSSVSIFGSAAAPGGWTKVATQSDKALRVVSGAGGGAGGTTGLSSTISLAHTHSISSQAGHQHTFASHRHNLKSTTTTRGAIVNKYVAEDSLVMRSTDGTAVTKNSLRGRTDVSGGGNYDANASHDHTGTTGSALGDIVIAYVDVLQCSKDSAGGAAYTDMSSHFLYKKLLTYQDLTEMAQNDDYLHYHTINSGAVMYFWQSAAPSGWTKLTSNHDRAMRITSGAGAGIAGSVMISAGFQLAHTHTIGSVSHDHNLPDHTHTLEVQSNTNAGNFENNWPVGTSLDFVKNMHNVSGASNPRFRMKPNFTTVVHQTFTLVAGSLTDSVSHDHGGATGSALSNVTLAYMDMIECQKD